MTDKIKPFILITLTCLIVAILNINALSQTPNQKAYKNATDVHPILVGSNLPDVEVTTTGNETITLKQYTQGKPTVFVFYRGNWCPFCTKHLGQLQSLFPELKKLGYNIAAIGPGSAKNILALRKKKSLAYALLGDPDMAVAKAFGIAFEIPENKNAKYGKLTKKFAQSTKQPLLPVPSVFVADKQGKIVFQHVDPNYRVRLPSAVLLAVAKAYQ